MRLKNVSKEVFKGIVYNFAVKDLETYVANGIVVHNCYKSNGNHHDKTDNMSFELFKSILDKQDKNILTQIAFGLCSIDSNSEMWKMFEYCRENNIVPNYTCNGLDVTEEIAQKTKQYCGAVAVSLVNKEQSFNAIKKFTNAGMTQVNIHYMLSMETICEAFNVIDNICSWSSSHDPRLAGLNAIVFLQYKPKGNGIGKFHPVASVDYYRALVDYAQKRSVSIGFDSCSAPLYLKTLAKYYPNQYKEVAQYVDPCESALHSFYCNFKGEFFPCSFAEGEGEWKKGLDIADYDNFLDLWKNERFQKWREALIGSSSGCKCSAKRDCRNCMLFPEITGCKGGVK